MKRKTLLATVFLAILGACAQQPLSENTNNDTSFQTTDLEKIEKVGRSRHKSD